MNKKNKIKYKTQNKIQKQNNTKSNGVYFNKVETWINFMIKQIKHT